VQSVKALCTDMLFPGWGDKAQNFNPTRAGHWTGIRPSYIFFPFVFFCSILLDIIVFISIRDELSYCVSQLSVTVIKYQR
jgi:hypothetical protein